MENYVFRCMVEDEDADIFYVEIEADNIGDARRIFKNRMKSFQCDWCLLRVYREI